MRLAFCLYHYFPFGGLQRDFLAIAQACQQRGHDIFVFTARWEGEVPAGFNVNKIKEKGLSNHQRLKYYSKQLQKKLTETPFDCVIGFNKMPGLDFYFAADGCFQEKARRMHGFFYRWSARYRQYVALEKSVFDNNKTCQILVLNEKEKQYFQRYYGTLSSRFHLLPPGIDENCVATPDAGLIANEVRDEFSVKKNEIMLLMVASDFKTKGLARCLEAMGALPPEIIKRVQFFIVGDDDPTSYRVMANKLKIAHRLAFLGPRNDVARFYMAADLFFHPARTENAGKVLLEALACGLPVITTDICGYAYHVQRSKAGSVLTSPFSQSALNQLLLHAIQDEQDRKKWAKNALAYVSGIDLFGMVSSAVSLIETGRP